MCSRGAGDWGFKSQNWGLDGLKHVPFFMLSSCSFLLVSQITWLLSSCSPLVILCPWSSCSLSFCSSLPLRLGLMGSWGFECVKGFLFFSSCSPGHLVPFFLVISLVVFSFLLVPTGNVVHMVFLFRWGVGCVQRGCWGLVAQRLKLIWGVGCVKGVLGIGGSKVNSPCSFLLLFSFLFP